MGLLVHGQILEQSRHGPGNDSGADATNTSTGSRRFRDSVRGLLGVRGRWYSGAHELEGVMARLWRGKGHKAAAAIRSRELYPHIQQFQTEMVTAVGGPTWRF